MSETRQTAAWIDRGMGRVSMGAAAMLIGVLLVVAAGCQIGTRRPLRDQARPYDLVPQSGYLADGPTVAADYAVPAPMDTSQKDLVRINALLTENNRLRQELAATTAALHEANDGIEQLTQRVVELDEKLERAEARAARRDRAKKTEEQ